MTRRQGHGVGERACWNLMAKMPVPTEEATSPTIEVPTVSLGYLSRSRRYICLQREFMHTHAVLISRGKRGKLSFSGCV